MNRAQLVQDVIDGNESPIKAWDILFEELVEINRCMKAIKPIVDEARKEKQQ
jgi:hypothetical protein